MHAVVSDSLRNRAIVVTGGSAGIGRTVVLRLAAEGARVAAVARRAERLAQLAAVHTARIVPVPGDISHTEAVEDLARRILVAVGPPDAVVHNVGIGQIVPFCSTTPADWEAVVRTNLMGTLALTRFLLPSMLERNAGTMLLVGSDAAPGWPFMTLYSATKAALEAAWRSLSREYRNTALHFATVIVGPTEGTEFADRCDPAAVERATAAWVELGLLRGKSATVDETAERIVSALRNPEGFLP